MYFEVHYSFCVRKKQYFCVVRFNLFLFFEINSLVQFDESRAQLALGIHFADGDENEIAKVAFPIDFNDVVEVDEMPRIVQMREMLAIFSFYNIFVLQYFSYLRLI